jgi:hypothetical protein
MATISRAAQKGVPKHPVSLFDALDYVAHRYGDDCAYLFGRECDCMQPTDLFNRLSEVGYVLIRVGEQDDRGT